jgi:hypothetical protein
VTAAAVAAVAFVAWLDYKFVPEADTAITAVLKVTVLIAEIGTAVLVIDHVAKMVWYRTFIGSFLRWLWHQLNRSKGGTGEGGGGSGSDDRTPQVTDDQPKPRRAQWRERLLQKRIPRLIELYMRSWAIPVVESSGGARFALTHPEPGSGLIPYGSMVPSIAGRVARVAATAVAGLIQWFNR